MSVWHSHCRLISDWDFRAQFETRRRAKVWVAGNEYISRETSFLLSRGTVACYRFRSLLRVRGVFEMERSIQASERRLLQISVDLLNRMAEIQKLRVAIRSKHRNGFRHGAA